MKSHSQLTAVMAVALAYLTFTPDAGAVIDLRVSVKIILDANNNLPTGNSGTNTGQFYWWEPYNYDTPQRIQSLVVLYNGLLDRMGWGYHIALTDVTTLSGVDQWFNTPARDFVQRSLLEAAAKANLSVYGYRDDAINVYINNSSSGVSGGHLPRLGDVIFIGATGYQSMLLHEIGHSLGLCHTFGCFCNGCGDPPDNCNSPGNDNIADTIRDSPCFTSQNDIAGENFSGSSYLALAAGQRRQVDDIFFNIMSYHQNPLDRLTHDQWEHIVDVANFEKRNVATGGTIFVDRNNTCIRPEDLAEPFRTLAGFVPGWSWGTRFGLGVTLSPQNPPPGAPALPCPPPPLPCSLTVCLGGPFKNIQDAVNSASAGDRLQIKAGSYNETMRITKAITLATDRALVTIGR